MDQELPTRAERRALARLAQALVEVCVRNSGIEDLHAGTFPDSEQRDFSDVKVVSPYGEIPWTKLSRISDDEMKQLMIEIVDRVFTFLTFPEELAVRSAQTRKWQRPRLDPELMQTVQRRMARSAAGSDTA